MISIIKGVLVSTDPGVIIIETNNIAYEIFMPEMQTTYLAAFVGSTVTIYTHMNVKEDEISLYGFLSGRDKWLFRRLLTVNGIGPKAGLNLLSSFTSETLIQLLATENLETISQCKGLGKKTAEKLVIELKKEMKEQCLLGNAPELSVSIYNEVLDALVSLGFSNLDAKKALKQVSFSDNITTKEAISLALKTLR